MKIFLILFLTTTLFYSCTNYKKEIIGQWIERNDFKSPRILEFSKDYFTKPHNDNDFIKFPYYTPTQYLYKIREDTILYCDYFKIFKYKLTINNNILVLPSEGLDTTTIVYNKNTYKNYIDYVNNRLNLSIHLPKGSFYALNWTYNSNSFYIDVDNHNHLRYLLNGKPISIDPNLHKKIFYKYGREVICFADNNVLVKDLNPLKVEISKAMYSIAYFALIDGDSLSMLPLVMPRVKYDMPDSLSKLMPPRPAIDISFFRNKPFILCEVYSKTLKVNGLEKTYEYFIQALKDKIFSKKNISLFLYYDENLTLGECVNFAIKLSHSIDSIRNSILEIKYNHKTYWQLSDEEKKEYNNSYNVYFNEILNDNLREMYKYL